MEDLQKIPIGGNKPCVRPYDIKKNMITVDIFRSEYLKNRKSQEELKLSQIFKQPQKYNFHGSFYECFNKLAGSQVYSEVNKLVVSQLYIMVEFLVKQKIMITFLVLDSGLPFHHKIRLLYSRNQTLRRRIHNEACSLFVTGLKFFAKVCLIV